MLKVKQTKNMTNLSSNMEDYLEAISIASAQSGAARVKDIRTLMNVKTPSVSGALQVLAKQGLVTHERYGRVQLTKTGEAIAAEVKKKHSVISAFLRDMVGVSQSVAEIDACKMEHILSKETFKKLMEFMAKQSKQ
jgi:DtxR family Mn-dependent transcriptional regulator